MLKVDTDPDCVVMTSEMLLIVGCRRGHVLMFNLRCVAYVGGQLGTLDVWKLNKNVAKIILQSRIEPSPIAMGDGDLHLIQCFFIPQESPL